MRITEQRPGVVCFSLQTRLHVKRQANTRQGSHAIRYRPGHSHQPHVPLQCQLPTHAHLSGEVFEVPVVLDPAVTDARGPLGAVDARPLGTEVPRQRHRTAPQGAAGETR